MLCYSQSYGPPSGHIWLRELDYKESRAPKSRCLQTVVLEKTPWTARRSNQSILREINPEYSFPRTDAEDEAPVFWALDANSQLIGKVPDAGKD